MTMLTRMPFGLWLTILVSSWQFWLLVDIFGPWLTRRVRVKLMSSGLLLLAGHLLLIGFRSHSQPLIIIDDEVSGMCRIDKFPNVSHLFCWMLRFTLDQEFPKSVVCVRLSRRTSNRRRAKKCQRKKNSRRRWRDFWPTLTSTAALSCLAVEYAALVNAHNPRFLHSIYNWTILTEN